jgi:hypothetical protein
LVVRLTKKKFCRKTLTFWLQIDQKTPISGDKAPVLVLLYAFAISVATHDPVTPEPDSPLA